MRPQARRVVPITLAAGILSLSVSLLVAETPANQPPATQPPPAKPAASATAEPAAPAAAGEQPAHVTVQHILIGFEGSVPGKNITRTKESARALATDVYARAKKGEDFDALVKQYTDDSAPGIYAMSNTDVPPKPIPPGARATGREFPRGNMVKSFGDVAFSLKVGEIGMAEYDHANSRFGWHIVKRLE